MKNKKKRKTLWDDWDGEYIGNIWGWKFSFLALALIILLGITMLARQCYLEEHPKEEKIIQE